MNKTLKEILVRFSSRKFLIAALGVAVVFGAPLSNEQITAITVLITAFVGVEGTADAITRLQ